MRVYQPRPIRFHEIRTMAGYRLKLYSIVDGKQPINWNRFESGCDLVMRLLPKKVTTPERPGVGFLIAHQGYRYDYVVLGWWDRENELPTRIAVRKQAVGARWRLVKGSESFCVWDIQVIAHERDAYVASMLTGNKLMDATEKYLSNVFSGS